MTSCMYNQADFYNPKNHSSFMIKETTWNYVGVKKTIRIETRFSNKSFYQKVSIIFGFAGNRRPDQVQNISYMFTTSRSAADARWAAGGACAGREAASLKAAGHPAYPDTVGRPSPTRGLPPFGVSLLLLLHRGIPSPVPHASSYTCGSETKSSLVWAWDGWG